MQISKYNFFYITECIQKLISIFLACQGFLLECWHSNCVIIGVYARYFDMLQNSNICKNGFPTKKSFSTVVLLVHATTAVFI